MKKFKEEIIEKTLYSGTNSQVVYKEIYKINSTVICIEISTDYSNTFGAKVLILNKDTLTWNNLYTLHKTLLNIYKEPSYNLHYESSELENKKNMIIGKFYKDVEFLKNKVIELLF